MSGATTSPAASGAPARRPHSAAFVSVVVSAALIVLIAAVTLTATTPSPPSVAELAPAARQQILDAPTEQSSEFGAGPGGSGGAGGTTTTTATPDVAGPGATTTTGRRVIDVPRVRRCIGSPPRQIEDPQSPPCVPYFEGDNGGATSKGVTKDEIRIAGFGTQRVLDALGAFFNRRFEFYGRKITLVTGAAGSGESNCSGRRTQAADAATRLDVFASIDPAGASSGCYYDELARRRVIAQVHDPQLAQGVMARNRPFLWQYPMAYDEEFAALGRWACARFAGKNAEHSRDPLLAGQKRKFGLILQYDENAYGFESSPLNDELKRCGHKLEAEYRITEDRSSGPTQGQHGVSDPTQAQNAILAMKNAGVTSVFCLCIIFIEQYIPSAATAQRYFPEWFLSTFLFNDRNYDFKVFWPGEDQRRSVMGLTFRPKQLRYADEPVVQAIQEVDPGFQFQISQNLNGARQMYQGLLLLASGLQMAGPNLTPESFERGLQRTTFPNPDTPAFAGKVGFERGSHSMTVDAAEMWWSQSAPSMYPDEGAGTWCYVESGRRRRTEDFKPGEPDPFFKGPCL